MIWELYLNLDKDANSKHYTHTLSLSLYVPICPSTAFYSPTHPHLYEHVSCIMETHDQSSNSCHVVHVGKSDEGDCCHMVQKHDQEILGTQLLRKRHIYRKYFQNVTACLSDHMWDIPITSRIVQRCDKVKRTWLLCADTMALRVYTN